MSPIATGSSPHNTCRSTSAVSAPVARAVPQLIWSGSDPLRASVSALPMWSLCSWVIRIASRRSTPKPTRPSLRSTSFAEKPQSSSTRVVVVPLDATTTSALPSLPLPRLVKRTHRLVTVRVQQRYDALRIRRRVDLPVRINDPNLRHVIALRPDVDAELLRRLLRPRAAGEQLAEQALALEFLHR